jgi:hypothetical protein
VSFHLPNIRFARIFSSSRLRVKISSPLSYSCKFERFVVHSSAFFPSPSVYSVVQPPSSQFEICTLHFPICNRLLYPLRAGYHGLKVLDNAVSSTPDLRASAASALKISSHLFLIRANSKDSWSRLPPSFRALPWFNLRLHNLKFALCNSQFAIAFSILFAPGATVLKSSTRPCLQPQIFVPQRPPR